MCQLSFIHTNNKISNETILGVQLLTNTVLMHQDGFGVFHNNLIYKEVVSPHTLSDLGNWINDCITTNKPIIAHVRQASAGTKVDIKNNHPFETPHLVLAHNGTLVIKREKKCIDHDKIFKDVIDTEVFLSYLETRYCQDGNLVKSLQDTMESFTGKFAFLLYEKKTDRYYAARGTTADLHISSINTPEGEFLGYIVNTDSKSLSLGLDISTAILQMNGTNVIYMPPVKLKDNTIFLLEDSGYTELGELKENKEVFSRVQRWVAGRYVDIEDDNTYSWWQGNNYNKSEDTIIKLINKANEFLDKYHMTIRDLDLICSACMGRPIAYLSDMGELDFFLDKMLGKLTSNVRKEVIKAVELRIKEVGPMTRFFYTDYKVQFPYMINERNWKELVSIINSRVN